MGQQGSKWKCHPKAERFISGVLDEYVETNSAIQHLQQDLLKHTSTRLFDWIDHVVIPHSPSLEKQLSDLGFEAHITSPSYHVYRHSGALLPRIMVRDANSGKTSGIGVNVDRIADFLMVRGQSAWIEGGPHSPFRRCCVSTEGDVSLWAVERRGTLDMEPSYPDEGYLQKVLAMKEKWQTRSRDLEDEDDGMRRTILLAEELVSSLGRDVAAWVVLECERRYWQARNGAGQVQKCRQDRLGMGWANHDHHTFRSSRRHFSMLVRLFETLGFFCRERFYAGAEAGWGAQVMEQENCGLVLFLDVDLEPHEVELDFGHHSLAEQKQLGTIGLWCALHGDSILKAGMHHLEAQFMFDELREDLSHHGIGMMDPFTDFAHLRQAFTAGEVWSIQQSRIQALLEAGSITQDEAERFGTYGGVGSHLENLQRREGFKGFNQQGVSVIIKKTDPRSVQL